MKKILTLIPLLVSFAALAQVPALDTLTLGTPVRSDRIIEVPLYLRDVSGTPLGSDRPPGLAIQGISLALDLQPEGGAFVHAEFRRSGVTADITPLFEATDFEPSLNRVWFFVVFEAPLPLRLDPPEPGDLIATLRLELAEDADPAIPVDYHFDIHRTMLSDRGGLVSETYPDSLGLSTEPPAPPVSPPVLSLAPDWRRVGAGQTGLIRASISHAIENDFEIVLSSSNPSAIRVPAAVSIPARQVTHDILIEGIAFAENVEISARPRHGDQAPVSVLASVRVPIPIGGGPTRISPGPPGIPTVTMAPGEARSFPFDLGAPLEFPVTIDLTSSAPHYASVDSSLTIPAGATAGEFTIHATPFPDKPRATATITAQMPDELAGETFFVLAVLIEPSAAAAPTIPVFSGWGLLTLALALAVTGLMAQRGL